jgi:hypothetical protein
MTKLQISNEILALVPETEIKEFFKDIDKNAEKCDHHYPMECHKKVAITVARYIMKDKDAVEKLNNHIKTSTLLEVYNYNFGWLQDDELFFKELAFKYVGEKFIAVFVTEKGEKVEIPVFKTGY